MSDEPEVIYEYAGFRYKIEDGFAVPLPGQHPAANKERHKMAAMECWRDDNKEIKA
jgi:hypothetical protein